MVRMACDINKRTIDRLYAQMFIAQRKASCYTGCNH